MTTDATKPTVTSTALAVVATAATVAALLAQVELVVQPAVIAMIGALAFAASLWLASQERLTTVPAVTISLLSVPIAAALLVGTGGAVLVLVGAFFPVQTASQLSVQGLFLLARVGMVVGVVFAVFGVALGVRNVVDTRTLANHYWVTVKAGLVPVVVGGVMIGGALLTKTANTPAKEPIVPTVASLGQSLLAPTGGTHLATLLALVAAAAVAVRATVDALPVAELLGDSGAGDIREHRVQTVTRLLGRLAGIAIAGAGLAVLVEVPTTPDRLRETIGAELFDWLVAVSTAPGPRLVLVGTLGVTVPTLLVVWGLRRMARGSARSAVRRLAPLSGGAVLTVVAMAVATPVLTAVVSWVEMQLPTAFAQPFRDVTESTIQFYGAPAIVVAFVAVLFAVTAVLVVAFRFALFLGYLSDETAGYSLASAGLFIAAAFAGVVSAPTWLVFGGLVASLFVWDAGHYGTVLGREIGRHAPTRATELVHAGGTLAVGLVGVGVAAGLKATLDGYTLPETPTATVAFVGVLTGLVLLIVALR